MICVPIPVFRFVFVIVGVVGILYDFLSLTDAWRSPYPVVIQLGEGVMLFSTVDVQVDVLLDFHVVLYVDLALFHCGLSSHLYEFLVMASLVAFFVEPCRLYSEGPGPFYPGFFFIAVIVCTVVDSNCFEV